MSRNFDETINTVRAAFNDVDLEKTENVAQRFAIFFLAAFDIREFAASSMPVFWDFEKLLSADKFFPLFTQAGRRNSQLLMMINRVLFE